MGERVKQIEGILKNPKINALPANLANDTIV